MKTMYRSVVLGLLFSGMGFAEGDGNKDWAEKAAMQYEEKAAQAAAQGNTKDAEIYLKMAQMKRDAGAAAKEGKSYSWDEYHALSAQLGGGKKEKHEKGEKCKDGEKEGKEKDHGKKDHEHKKEKGNPGDGFIGAAQEYQKLSIEAAKAGDSEKAAIYGELAKMKLDAAAAANRGEGYDWTAYHELKGKLGK